MELYFCQSCVHRSVCGIQEEVTEIVKEAEELDVKSELAKVTCFCAKYQEEFINIPED